LRSSVAVNMCINCSFFTLIIYNIQTRIRWERQARLQRSTYGCPNVAVSTSYCAGWLSTFGRLRTFSVAGPTSWNSLPYRLRDSTLSSDRFRGNY